MRPAMKADIRDYLKRCPELRDGDLDKEDWYWSDFSNQKNFNPILFNNALKFWSNILIETSKRGWLSEDILCLNRENLGEVFSVHRGVSPLGLNCVIQELYHSSELIPIEEFYSYITSNNSWSSWIIQSLFWGLQKVTGSNNVSDAKKLIVMPTLKEAADRVLQHHEKNAVHGITDNLYTLTSFKSEYAAVAIPNVVLSEIDLKVLLHYLEFNQKILITEVWHGTSEEKEELIIKMRSKEKNIPKLEISEADRGIICIKETSKKLRVQVEDVEKKIADLNRRINGYVIRKQKVQARYSLRQKKNLGKILLNRISSLDSIEGILLKIQGVASDSEIVDIYSFGAGVLKGVLASEGLTTETVDATMDKLQEALVDQKEIEDAMQVNQTLIEASEIDEELEQELEALLEEEDLIVSTPTKQPVSQPITESVISQKTGKYIAKEQPEETTSPTLQPVLNVEDEELAELERMFAEMEAVPQHTPRPVSKSKQNEEMMYTE